MSEDKGKFPDPIQDLWEQTRAWDADRLWAFEQTTAKMAGMLQGKRAAGVDPKLLAFRARWFALITDVFTAARIQAEALEDLGRDA